MKQNTALLSDAEALEFVPHLLSRPSGDERLAGLLGYLTGDGSIGVSRPRYMRKSGEVSVYERVHGAFYSSVRADLEEIREDLSALGLNTGQVRKKAGETGGYQLQIGETVTRIFIDAGHPIGSKTAQDFRVPDWIMSGSAEIKRAYLSALWGAEGTTPAKDKASKARMPRQPVLNMCKKEGLDGTSFFADLQILMRDLGVEASVTVTGTGYRTWWLRVGGGAENLVRFFERVGYAYCAEKQLSGWLWAKYLRAYLTEAARRRHTIIQMRADGQTFADIGRVLGISKGAAARMYADVAAGKATTAGQGFPHFADWIASRWNEKKGVLRLAVAGRNFRPEPVTVWNMLVDSPDHSYLLASGANNFNSFETMSGRVYYAFDRAVHVGEYKFNPQLPIYIGMDFNVDPMSAIICQEQSNGEVWVVDECILYGSNVQETSDELMRRYFRYLDQISIYPDPAGNNRNHDRGESSLDILREAGFSSIYFKRKHPLVADRVNAVNRLFRAADGTVRFRVDASCRKFIDAAEQVVYKEGSREIDKSQGKEHPMDAFGYYADFRHPVRQSPIMGLSI